MKISQLAAQPQNPRTITSAKLAQLKRALLEFGDLSGIVFNKKTAHLVGGHQRVQNFRDGKIVYTKRYAKPTRTGTIAEGYVVLQGERYGYREVSWPLVREKAANIAANKSAGEWNLPQLSEWMKELGSFDLEFDLDLTMFDSDEIAELPTSIDVGAHTRTAKAEPDEEEDAPAKPAKCRKGQLYALGASQLRCGNDDLHFCDKVIALWERYSGEDAILISVPKNPASQARGRDAAHTA